MRYALSLRPQWDAAAGTVSVPPRPPGHPLCRSRAVHSPQ